MWGLLWKPGDVLSKYRYYPVHAQLIPYPRSALLSICRNLHDIAMKDKAYRQAHGKGKQPRAAVGGAGIGFGGTAAPPPYSGSYTVAATPPPAGFISAAASASTPDDSAALPPPPPRPPVAATPAERPLPTAVPSAPTPPVAAGQQTRFDRAAGSAAPAAVPAAAAPPGFARAAASPAATLTRAQQSGNQAAAVTMRAPRGFVRSSETVGGGSSVPQIVLPSGTPKPVEAPAPWLQKRLQVRHATLGLLWLQRLSIHLKGHRPRAWVCQRLHRFCLVRSERWAFHRIPPKPTDATLLQATWVSCKLHSHVLHTSASI